MLCDYFPLYIVWSNRQNRRFFRCYCHIVSCRHWDGRVGVSIARRADSNTNRCCSLLSPLVVVGVRVPSAVSYLDLTGPHRVFIFHTAANDRFRHRHWPGWGYCQLSHSRIGALSNHLSFCRLDIPVVSVRLVSISYLRLRSTNDLFLLLVPAPHWPFEFGYKLDWILRLSPLRTGPTIHIRTDPSSTCTNVVAARTWNFLRYRYLATLNSDTSRAGVETEFFVFERNSSSRRFITYCRFIHRFNYY